MSSAIEPIRKPRELHIRVTDAQHRTLQRLSRQMHQPIAGVVTLLVEEAMATRRNKDAEPRDPEELDIQILVAVEQVIALVESIHPRGPGIAAQYFSHAANAARARLGADEEPPP